MNEKKGWIICCAGKRELPMGLIIDYEDGLTDELGYIHIYRTLTEAKESLLSLTEGEEDKNFTIKKVKLTEV